MAAKAGSERTPENAQESDGSSMSNFLAEMAFAPHRQPPDEAFSLAGETLGRYQIEKLLGRGGMGVVYAAVDLTLRRKVALKVLPAEAVENDERRRRLLREAQSAAAVSHPNIATVFDAGEAGAVVFIAMEYVEGRSLRSLMQAAGTALPEAVALRIAREIAAGLAAAHRAGVIHRDIKPENVMIGSRGEVKLLDFGLAKLHDAGGPGTGDLTTRNGRILGTTSYMSPEQARGHFVDARSDVFALGVVLYEMLAGERPFRGATATDVLAAIVRDEPPPLISRRGAGGVSDVVSRCLEKDPSKRYSDAGELFAALDLGASSRTAPAWRPRWFWVALPAAAAAITASWVALRTPATPPRAAPSAVPAVRPTAITDLPLPPSGNPDAIAAYQAAIQSFRDARWGQAELSLRRALELDPGLGIAYLRLALILAFFTPTSEAKAAYRDATRLRNGLTPRDRTLLSAFEPLLSADPADMAETERRLAKMAEQYPLDAEVFQLLAIYRRFDSAERRLEAARRATEIDPEYADAWQQVGAALTEADPDGAIAALERCTAIAATATDCWGERGNVEGVLGRCAGAEAHLRRATSDPHASDTYFQNRAHTLYALEKPREAVTEAFRQRWARIDAASVHEEELHDSALIAASYGDFEMARLRATEGLRWVDPQPTLRAHARFALLLTDIALETGRVEAARAIAADFLDRRDAWQLGQPTEDPTVYLTRVAARAGALSDGEVRERRDGWYRAWKPTTSVQKAEVWHMAYAYGIERAHEAAEALAARPDGARWTIVNGALDAGLGRVLWLGGKRDEALPHLSRTFTRCDAFPSIFDMMRSNLLFGRALEERGHRDRACEVYGAIVARWGAAKPRSVTAGEARNRAAALGCNTP